MINQKIRYLITFTVTCMIFYIEALTHYNIGKSGKLGFGIPPFKENIMVISTIMLFSFISSGIIFIVERLLDSF